MTMQTMMGEFKSVGTAMTKRAELLEEVVEKMRTPLPQANDEMTVVRPDGTFTGPAPITRGLDLGDKY